MSRFFMDLDAQDSERLAELARQERRSLRDQAAVLLERAIKSSAAPSSPANSERLQLVGDRPGAA